jgi:probable FeS assembly SUF system protein SufT
MRNQMDNIRLRRDCEVISIPKGLRQTLAKDTDVGIVQERSGSFTVSTTNHAMYRVDAKDADALGLETSSPVAASAQFEGLSEELVWNTLRTIYDPELPVNVVDLGLIYSCEVKPKPDGYRKVSVLMTVTSPGCGMSEVLKSEVEQKLLSLPRVSEAHVEIVFDPPWDRSRMSESARLQTGADIGERQGFVQISRNR